MTEQAGAVVVTSMGWVRQRIAACRGAAPSGTGTRCALCGVSPYPIAGPTARVLGATFADWAMLLDPASPTVCEGCRLLLSGRPGDDPPPLRTRSVALIAGTLHVLDVAALWTLLTAPPDDLAVLSWATSGQRQHLLWADRCTPPLLRVGADGRTITWHAEREAPLAQALLSLRRAKPAKPGAKPSGVCTRDEIATGQYRPATITTLGAEAWQAAEAIVSAYRGTDALTLALAHCPITSLGAKEAPAMVDPTDAAAVRLLVALARDSDARKHDGLRFWSGLLQRRIQRFSRRPLADFVSALLQELAVPVTAPGAVETCAIVQGLTPPDAEAIMAALRARPTLLVALAFDALKDSRAAAAQRKARAASSTPETTTNTTIGDLLS